MSELQVSQTDDIDSQDGRTTENKQHQHRE
jgi:hypothetical protein